MPQSSGNVLAALKRETTMGTAATGGAGGFVLPLVDSPGLNLGRGEILSARRNRNQIRQIGRLGAKTVQGSYTTEVLPGGAIDLLLESLARGAYGALASEPTISATTQVKKVATPAIPIYHSYTIEQYDADIDESELFLGVRLVGARIVLNPNAPATIEWTFQGLDRDLIPVASAPYYTTPTELNGVSLIADDSTIKYKGATIALLTGMEINLQIAAATQPVIGSVVSPDVFMNDLAITGSVSAVRDDLTALTDFDAETEFEISAVMKAPGAGAVATLGIVLPRTKISGIDAQFLGGDASKIETRNIQVGPTAGDVAVEFYTSTETPVAVV